MSNFINYANTLREDSVDDILSLPNVTLTITRKELLGLYKNRRTKIPVKCRVCNTERAVSAASIMITKTSNCARCVNKAAAEQRKNKKKAAEEDSEPTRLLNFVSGKDEKALEHCRELIKGHFGRLRQFSTVNLRGC